MSEKNTRAKIKTGDSESVVETVRERYAAIVTAGTSCCGPATTSCCGTAVEGTTHLGYDSVDLDLLPEGADLGLGCGAPLEFLELEAGESVLDLGSGAGIDALIAARRVGKEGRVIGVDMTPEMIVTARKNAEKAGVEHVDFRKGRLENLPVDDVSVDAVTSNCVINLVPDKAGVFAEISRVLRPGGRLVVSDIVLDGDLPDAVGESVLAYVGCVAGAERRERYFAMLADAGLREVEILKDIDFLGVMEKVAPTEAASLMTQAGVVREEVAGMVRSVTYRARKSGGN